MVDTEAVRALVGGDRYLRSSITELTFEAIAKLGAVACALKESTRNNINWRRAFETGELMKPHYLTGLPYSQVCV